MAYVEAHKASFGVEPICEVLEVAPSTYYAARNRQPCARAIRDTELKVEIERVYAHNRHVYGPRKVWRQLNREGICISRCRTERLMRQMGLSGRSRARKRRTTIPADVGMRPADLVDRRFVASQPNQLWVADITYSAQFPVMCSRSAATEPLAWMRAIDVSLRATRSCT